MGMSLDTATEDLKRSREIVSIELLRRTLSHIHRGAPTLETQVNQTLGQVATILNQDASKPSVVGNDDLIRLFHVIKSIAALALAEEHDEGPPLDPNLLFGLGQIAGLAVQYIHR